MASPKGKARAADAAAGTDASAPAAAADASRDGDADAPVVLSDTDSDTDFFTVKRRTFTKTPSAPRPREPSPELWVISSDDSYDSDGAAKRRRKRKKTPARTLPEWTRAPHAESSRRAAAAADPARGPSQGASRDRSPSLPPVSPARTRKAVIELTPPPEMSEEQTGELKQRLREHFALDDEPLPPTSPPPRSSSPVVDEGRPIVITVRMVADEERRKSASANAVRAYERGRKFTLGQRLIRVLADRLQKLPDELVLVHNDRRIFATGQPLDRLDLFDGSELTGYEKYAWEAAERRRKEDRARRLAVLDPDTFDALAGADEADARVGGAAEVAAAGAPEPAAPPVERIRLTLRGAKGEFRLAATKTTTAAKMCRYYCSKTGADPAGVGDMWIEMDGERVDPEQTVDGMELENDDLVDVHGG